MQQPTRLRLFIVEAPSPKDLLEGRAEAPALEKVCTLIGHDVASFTLRCKSELQTTIEFISSIGGYGDDSDDNTVPLCVHIAAHGNENELGFGLDSVTWDELFALLKPLCNMSDYPGGFILIISACKAAHQKLSKKFAGTAKHDEDFHPPTYLFITADEAPTFADAVVAWTVFYHQLPKISLNDKNAVQTVLAKTKAAGATTLRYYRWNSDQRLYHYHEPSK